MMRPSSLSSTLAILTQLMILALVVPVSAQAIPRVTILETADADQLNPFTSFTATGNSVNEYLFFSLLRGDKRTAEYIPLLAQALPVVSSDQKQLTYTLHSEARFNNGHKVTARDVAFSFKVLRNPFVNNGQQRSQYDAITGIKVLDERRIMFQVAKPNIQSLRLTGEFPVMAEDFFDPSHQMEGVSLNGLERYNSLPQAQRVALKEIADRINLYGSSLSAFSAEPTCGSYIPVSWKKGSEIVLQANARFWGKKMSVHPYFQQNVDEIRFEICNDQATIRKGIFEKRYDLVAAPRTLYAALSDIPVLASNFDFINQEGPSYGYIGINMRAGRKGRNPAIEDLQVRQALAQAVYVDEMMAKASAGLGTRIAIDCPPGRPEARNPDLPLIAHDPKGAAALLDQGGWTDSDNNGIREKMVQGEEVVLVLECIYNEESPSRKVIAELLQEQAKRVGILVTLSPLPWKEYLMRLSAGDFDLYIGAWVSDPSEDSYRQIWHTQSAEDGSNFVGFGNELSDQLIEYYDETIEPQAHIALGMEIQRLIYEQQPYIFLWADNQCLIRSKRYSTMPSFNAHPGYWVADWQ